LLCDEPVTEKLPIKAGILGICPHGNERYMPNPFLLNQILANMKARGVGA
jgi:hypothetical protein